MFNNFRIVVASLVILLTTQNIQAQTYKSAASKTNIAIAINPSLEDEIFLVFKEKDRTKQNFRLKIDGPNGLRVSIRSAMSKKGEASIFTAETGSSYSTKVFIKGGPGKAVHEIGGTTGNATRDPNCGCLTDSEITNWLELLASVGQFYTKEQLCEQIYNPVGESCSGYPGGNPNNASGTILRSFISRDQCSSNSHLAIVKLNLAQVDKGAGGTIKLVGKFKSFKGKKASSIKPKGEGKYPQPLLLASPVGNFYDFSNQAITLNKWNSNSKSSSSITIADVIYYSPVGPLLRVPLSYSILTGERATFDITNQFSGYSICATLQAKRQYFNGYTN